ncbi:MAG: glycosyltransferase family 39 protein [Candidatus Aureabacteria bacterium]|nr:glycosyltransferase family 39 protein [Candidatus Auribacterota bacterium]
MIPLLGSYFDTLLFIQAVLLGVYLLGTRKISPRPVLLALIIAAATIGQSLVYPPAFLHIGLGAALLTASIFATLLLFLRSPLCITAEAQGVSPPPLSRRVLPWVFVLLMALSLFLRLYHYVDAIPGLDIDESVKGRIGIEIAEGTVTYHPFFHLRESLYFYLVAAAFRLFGISVPVLRSVSLVNAMLMLVVLFFFVRSLFGDYPAIAATFFLSFSIWHNTISKIAERLGLAPQFQLLVLYLLYLSYRKGRWYYFVLCGVSLALGFFGYPPFRVVPLSVALIFVYILFTDPGFYRRRAPHLILFAVAFCVTSLAPLGKNYAKWPEYYLSKKPLGYSVDPSVKDWAEFKNNLPYLIQTWNRSTAPYGTPRPFENIPLLSPLVGILFLIGMGYSISQARKLPYFMITTSFCVGLIPALFAWPFERRLVGATIMTYIFAGIALALIIRTLCSFPDRPWGCRYAAACFIASLIFIGRENWNILVEKFYPWDHYVVTTLPYQYAARMADNYFIYFDSPWFNENSYIFYRHTALIPGHIHKIQPLLLGELKSTRFEQEIPLKMYHGTNVCLILANLVKKDAVTRMVTRYYPDAIIEKHCDAKGREVFYSFLIAKESLSRALEKESK